MYQVQNGDYAALIHKLDTIALKKIQAEAQASLKEHQRHSSVAPKSYASLDHSDNGELTQKLMREDEKRFARIRGDAESQAKELRKEVEHELSSLREHGSILKAGGSAFGVLLTFIIFAIIAYLPSDTTGSDLEIDFDPMFLVFLLAVFVIVTAGILGNNHAKSKKQGEKHV